MFGVCTCTNTQSRIVQRQARFWLRLSTGGSFRFYCFTFLEIFAQSVFAFAKNHLDSLEASSNASHLPPEECAARCMNSANAAGSFVSGRAQQTMIYCFSHERINKKIADFDLCSMFTFAGVQCDCYTTRTIREAAVMIKLE